MQVVPMRSKFWSLYRSLLNVHYGWSAGKYYFLKKRQRIWEPIVIVVSLLPVAFMGMAFLWYTTEQLFLAGLGFGQPHLPLVYGALMVSTLGLFFGFFYVLSAFYFSSDLSILATLPFRSWEILLAKLGVVLTGQYALNSLMLLPIWVRYAILAKPGWGYLLTALVVFLSLPVIPLVLASVASVLLMRFVNLSRHKDKLTLFGGIILLLVVFGFQFWMQNSLSSDDPNVVLNQLLSQADGLVKMVGKVFPPSVWAAQALAYVSRGMGWLNLFYLVLASFLGLGALYLIGEKVFMQGLIAGLEASKGTGRRRALSQGEQKPQRVFWSLTKMEMKLFVRDPSFALNGLVGYVVFPFMAFLPMFGQSMEGNPFELLKLNELDPLLVAGGVALFFGFMTSMSLIPSTTFSREGKYLWIVRSLPLPIEQLIVTRVVAAQIVNTLGCVAGLIPAVFFFRWSVGAVVLGSGLGILLAGSLSVLLVLFDLRRPMLDWVNPVKAVKSNLNAILGLLAITVLILFLGFLFYLNVKTQTLWLIPLELIMAILVFGSVDFVLVRRLAQGMWSRI